MEPAREVSEGQRLERVREEAVCRLESQTEDVGHLQTHFISSTLPLTRKYLHIAVGEVLTLNIQHTNPTVGLNTIATAFNILEKYGRNLLNAVKPKFWRSVKFNNPVFKSTIHRIQGARHVLSLYGYTHTSQDGLSFPDEVKDVDRHQVASVLFEVSTFRMELGLLVKASHPHPQLFAVYMWGAASAQEIHQPEGEKELTADMPVDPSTPDPVSCSVCGRHTFSVFCLTCDWHLCQDCDCLYHQHPDRLTHHRLPAHTASSEQQQQQQQEEEEEEEVVEEEEMKNPVPSVPPVLTKLPPASPQAPDVSGTFSRSPWECQACTYRNLWLSPLCEACARPRLSAPPVPPSAERGREAEGQREGECGCPLSQSWECGHCTYLNTKTGRICSMCHRTSVHTPSPGAERERETLGKGSTEIENEIKERKRQEEMRNEGQRLIQLIRVGEVAGFSAEEVACGRRVCGGQRPVAWLEAQLPALLEGIAKSASEAGLKPISLEEARRAFLLSDGNPAHSVRECVCQRLRQCEELSSLGFSDRDAISEALYTNGGDVEAALMDLQRKLLEPFHTAIWDLSETEIDLNRPDSQQTLRQLLAVYKLPSWGRAEIVLSIMSEGDHFSLKDVVDSAKESQDKSFIKRMLSHPCPICFEMFPRHKMQSLTSCECLMCSGCFKEHFTLIVKERHIKDLVCPICGKPEIDEESELINYFSTLDVQLRDCLEKEVYSLFHKKLIERTLMKDPKFKWCNHCSNGFIYDGNQLRVTCPQCYHSFCFKCNRPWESQHQNISCDEFQDWKRLNDPEYQAQGLAAYLQDNGIACPGCKFRYALAKGGCMHFTCYFCRHEFCSGCYNTFYGLKKVCPDGNCRLLKALHAHHPRDCLFYLRDWSVERLQSLLKNNKVDFNTEPPKGAQTVPGDKCRVMEQKDTQGNAEVPCSKDAPAGHAGLCLTHYKEYLVWLINAGSLDPASLFDEDELRVCLERSGTCLPPAPPGDSQGALQILSSIPLGLNIPRMKK